MALVLQNKINPEKSLSILETTLKVNEKNSKNIETIMNLKEDKLETESKTFSELSNKYEKCIEEIVHEKKKRRENQVSLEENIDEIHVKMNENKLQKDTNLNHYRDQLSTLSKQIKDVNQEYKTVENSLSLTKNKYPLQNENIQKYKELLKKIHDEIENLTKNVNRIMDAKEEKEQHLKLMKQNYENSKSTISELKKEIIDKNHILRKMEDKMKSILKDVDSLSKQNVIFDTYHNNMIFIKIRKSKIKRTNERNRKFKR